MVYVYPAKRSLLLAGLIMAAAQAGLGLSANVAIAAAMLFIR